MDIVSHALIGAIIADPQKASATTIFWSSFFSVLPDIPQFPLYFYVGYKNKRKFFWPKNEDWRGFSTKYPKWALQYFVPHSLFSLFIVVPFVLFFKLPVVCFLAYFLHIVLDIFTHTGEWSVKPFYPFKFRVSGFTDAWFWPPPYWAVSWAVLYAIILLFRF